MVGQRAVKAHIARALFVLRGGLQQVEGQLRFARACRGFDDKEVAGVRDFGNPFSQATGQLGAGLHDLADMGRDIGHHRKAVREKVHHLLPRSGHSLSTRKCAQHALAKRGHVSRIDHTIARIRQFSQATASSPQ